MITTNDENLYKKLLMLRTHGITRDINIYTNDTDFAAGIATDTYPGWYMEMQTLGYNYRLTDFQAALGSFGSRTGAQPVPSAQHSSTRYSSRPRISP